MDIFFQNRTCLPQLGGPAHTRTPQRALSLHVHTVTHGIAAQIASSRLAEKLPAPIIMSGLCIVCTNRGENKKHLVITFQFYNRFCSRFYDLIDPRQFFFLRLVFSCCDFEIKCLIFQPISFLQDSLFIVFNLQLFLCRFQPANSTGFFAKRLVNVKLKE